MDTQKPLADETNWHLHEIADEKARAVAANKMFAEFIGRGLTIENVEKLFIFGSTMNIVKDTTYSAMEMPTDDATINGKFLDLIVQDITHRYPHDEKHWKLLKMGLHRGIMFDDSAASYSCVYHYLFHAFYSLNQLYGFIYLDVEFNANLEKSKKITNLEIMSTLKLFVDCGGHLALSKVLEDRMFIFEVMAFFRRSSGQQSDGLLLKFLLEHGLNPNYEHTNPYGSTGTSLLAEALKHSAWANAAVLLEYGAVIANSNGSNNKSDLSAGFVIGPTVKNVATRVPNFQRYFDWPGMDGKDHDRPVKEILRTGIENFRKRREEVYPAHLKLAMEQNCPECLLFDVSPLTTIISEYLLHK